MSTLMLFVLLLTFAVFVLGAGAVVYLAYRYPRARAPLAALGTYTAVFITAVGVIVRAVTPTARGGPSACLAPSPPPRTALTECSGDAKRTPSGKLLDHPAREPVPGVVKGFCPRVASPLLASPLPNVTGGGLCPGAGCDPFAQGPAVGGEGLHEEVRRVLGTDPRLPCLGGEPRGEPADVVVGQYRPPWLPGREGAGAVRAVHSQIWE